MMIMINCKHGNLPNKCYQCADEDDPTVVHPPKKLAIVCGAPSSEMDAPWDDKEYEIWVLGNRCDRYPRFERIFEIHEDLEQHPPQYAEWLVAKGVPIVASAAFPVKSELVEIYPYRKATELLGKTHMGRSMAPYLTSSSAMMLAYAMLHGYQHMELYGVDMAVDDFEYFWQRPCMETWIGFARGRGHTVLLPSSSPVCRSRYVEGLGSRPVGVFNEAGFKQMAQRHSDMIADAERQIAVLQAAVQGHDGARQAYTQMARVARATEAGNDIQDITQTVALKDEIKRNVR